MRQTGFVAFVGIVAMCTSAAHAQSNSESAPGVNPKDNITMVELLYKFDRLEGGGAINSLTFKYDKVFVLRTYPAPQS